MDTIADYGNTTAMIHSPDFGKTWRLEPLPEDPDIPKTRPMGVTIVDSQTVWAAIKSYPELYRTMDSGAIWGPYSLKLSGLGDIMFSNETSPIGSSCIPRTAPTGRVNLCR